jgi:perosamine synthetase
VQALPVPGLPPFQSKLGYGHGCPWTCRFGRDVEYRAEDYPATMTICRNRAQISGLNAANSPELAEQFADGFRKVSERIDRVVQLAEEGE